MFPQLKKTNLATLGLCAAFYLGLLSQVEAQVDYDSIKTPQDARWLEAVDFSRVLNSPVRPVGSGICPETACDTIDETDACFESCGNAPSPDDIFGCPQDHHWALTFDDGPSPFTNDLLDILDRENIKATFCVMGAHAEQYPEILKRAYQAGHQIASHTYSHPHLMSLTNEQIVYEVKATEDAIEKAIGAKPRYIRPPFGEADARVKSLFKAMGYKVLLWNVDPTDYDVYMREDVDSKIQGTFRMAAQGNDTGLNLHEDPGFISLQHDLYKESVEQVPKVIQYLKSHGYKLTTAAECNRDSNPHEITNLSAAAATNKNETTTATESSTASSSSTTSESSSQSKAASSTSSAGTQEITLKKLKPKTSDSTRYQATGYALSAVTLAIYSTFFM